MYRSGYFDPWDSFLKYATCMSLMVTRLHLSRAFIKPRRGGYTMTEDVHFSAAGTSP